MSFLLALLTLLVTAAAETPFETPLLAIWQDDAGRAGSAQGPLLRMAIWSNGKVFFAERPHQWTSPLRMGKVEPSQLAELKKAVAATGVFALAGNCYLVPDAPVDCLMLDFGKPARQMLYWDEREEASYGINVHPSAARQQFVTAWKAVNQLAEASLPRISEPWGGTFQRPPKAWRLKPPIQSR